jgi:type III secretory pathway component EscR
MKPIRSTTKHYLNMIQAERKMAYAFYKSYQKKKNKKMKKKIDQDKIITEITVSFISINFTSIKLSIPEEV